MAALIIVIVANVSIISYQAMISSIGTTELGLSTSSAGFLVSAVYFGGIFGGLKIALIVSFLLTIEIKLELIPNDIKKTSELYNPSIKLLEIVTPHFEKHKKVFKAVKGQWGRRKNTIRVARQAMEKAMQYAYRDRRNKKREFKSLWIQRINAGVRSEGMTYSKFINGLSKSGIKLDRKILAEIAYDNPEAFKTIVKKAQSALN